MGKLKMQAVQKALHLDTRYDNFETWDEVLDFKVDGVQIRAIATHKWREETVRIVSPFEVEGEDYLQGFRPPLMAVGLAMKARQQRLQAQGLSVREDCIRMATNTYRLHATYLRIKPQIDREQQQYARIAPSWRAQWPKARWHKGASAPKKAPCGNSCATRRWIPKRIRRA